MTNHNGYRISHTSFDGFSWLGGSGFATLDQVKAAIDSYLAKKAR